MSKHHEVISITNIWYDTWKILSDHFLKFLFVTAIPLLVTYIFYWSTIGSFVFSTKILENPAEIFSAKSGFVYFAIIAALIIFIVQIIGAIALLVTTVNHSNVKLTEIIYKSLDFFWSFVLLGIYFLIILVLGMLFGYILLAVLGALIGLLSLDYLDIFFNSFISIPALITIIMAFFLVFAPYLLIDGQAKAWESMRKSFHLVKNYFWQIVIRLLIAYAIITTVAFILSFIPVVGASLAALISLPILTIYTYVLYQDIKPKTS